MIIKKKGGVDKKWVFYSTVMELPKGDPEKGTLQFSLAKLPIKIAGAPFDIPSACPMMLPVHIFASQSF